MLYASLSSGYKAITVEMAARIHRVPLAEFLEILHKVTTDKN